MTRYGTIRGLLTSILYIAHPFCTGYIIWAWLESSRIRNKVILIRNHCSALKYKSLTSNIRSNSVDDFLCFEKLKFEKLKGTLETQRLKVMNKWRLYRSQEYYVEPLYYGISSLTQDRLLWILSNLCLVSSFMCALDVQDRLFVFVNFSWFNTFYSFDWVR